MNPFVNPNRRSVLLPNGCKDLADVLRLPALETGDRVQIFIRQMLLHAEIVHASEIVIREVLPVPDGATLLALGSLRDLTAGRIDVWDLGKR